MKAISKLIVVSPKAKVNNKEELAQVLVEELDGLERLFILTVGFGELESLLDAVGAKINIEEAVADEHKLKDFIEMCIDDEKIQEYSLDPYYEPQYVVVHGKQIDAKEIIKEQGCGFVTAGFEEYFIY